MLPRLARCYGLLVALWAGAALAEPLRVYFFDVGQGDSALVLTPGGKKVLIDAGPPEAGATLAKRLSELARGPLDLLVLTHPHLDHLGGMREAVRAVGAKRYLEPDFDHPSEAYQALLEYLGTLDLEKLATADRANPTSPVRYTLEPGIALDVLWPRVDEEGKPVEPFLSNTRSDVNANSLVLRLTYGKTSFLFVGDAEADTEELLLKKNVELGSTLLKVAHHGSRHSSGAKFLAKVRPRLAVISCAAKNDYGHPTKETLERLVAAGAKIYRTDLQGELVAESDGQAVSVKAQRSTDEPRLERPSPWRAAAGYVASRRSKVFHSASCPAVKEIKPANLLSFTLREEAARERRPAADCSP